jgi:predicted nucleotidyltransferase
MAEVALLPLRALVESHREEIKAVVTRHKGKAVAIFGSVARGEETAASDIDFLVEFDSSASLFDLMHVEDDLRALLPCELDVISLGGLKPRDHDIRTDAVWL